MQNLAEGNCNPYMTAATFINGYGIFGEERRVIRQTSVTSGRWNGRGG